MSFARRIVRRPRTSSGRLGLSRIGQRKVALKEDDKRALSDMIVASLHDLVGTGVFSSLRAPERLRDVFIAPDTHTLAWPGGIDLCPDALYLQVTGRTVGDVFPNLSAPESRCA